jgi:hypothetical protein
LVIIWDIERGEIVKNLPPEYIFSGSHGENGFYEDKSDISHIGVISEKFLISRGEFTINIWK